MFVCAFVVPCPQYDLNLAGPALDYVGGDAARLSDPLVSPLLGDYKQPFPATLIQVGGGGPVVAQQHSQLTTAPAAGAAAPSVGVY